MKRKGIVLIFTLFIVLFITILVSFIMNELQNSIFLTKRATMESRAYWAANAGLNYAESHISENMSWPYKGEFESTDKYDIKCTSNNNCVSIVGTNKSSKDKFEIIFTPHLHVNTSDVSAECDIIPNNRSGLFSFNGIGCSLPKGRNLADPTLNVNSTSYFLLPRKVRTGNEPNRVVYFPKGAQLYIAVKGSSGSIKTCLEKIYTFSTLSNQYPLAIKANRLIADNMSGQFLVTQTGGRTPAILCRNQFSVNSTSSVASTDPFLLVSDIVQDATMPADASSDLLKSVVESTDTSVQESLSSYNDSKSENNESLIATASGSNFLSAPAPDTSIDSNNNLVSGASSPAPDKTPEVIKPSTNSSNTLVSEPSHSLGGNQGGAPLNSNTGNNTGNIGSGNILGGYGDVNGSDSLKSRLGSGNILGGYGHVNDPDSLKIRLGKSKCNMQDGVVYTNASSVLLNDISISNGDPTSSELYRLTVLPIKNGLESSIFATLPHRDDEKATYRELKAGEYVVMQAPKSAIGMKSIIGKLQSKHQNDKDEFYRDVSKYLTAVYSYPNEYVSLYYNVNGSAYVSSDDNKSLPAKFDLESLQSTKNGISDGEATMLLFKEGIPENYSIYNFIVDKSALLLGKPEKKINFFELHTPSKELLDLGDTYRSYGDNEANSGSVAATAQPISYSTNTIQIDGTLYFKGKTEFSFMKFDPKSNNYEPYYNDNCYFYMGNQSEIYVDNELTFKNMSLSGSGNVVANDINIFGNLRTLDFSSVLAARGNLVIHEPKITNSDSNLHLKRDNLSRAAWVMLRAFSYAYQHSKISDSDTADEMVQKTMQIPISEFRNSFSVANGHESYFDIPNQHLSGVAGGKSVNVYENEDPKHDPAYPASPLVQASQKVTSYIYGTPTNWIADRSILLASAAAAAEAQDSQSQYIDNLEPGHGGGGGGGGGSYNPPSSGGGGGGSNTLEPRPSTTPRNPDSGDGGYGSHEDPVTPNILPTGQTIDILGHVYHPIESRTVHPTIRDLFASRMCLKASLGPASPEWFATTILAYLKNNNTPLNRSYSDIDKLFNFMDKNRHQIPENGPYPLNDMLVYFQPTNKFQPSISNNFKGLISAGGNISIQMNNADFATEGVIIARGDIQLSKINNFVVRYNSAIPNVYSDYLSQPCKLYELLYNRY